MVNAQIWLDHWYPHNGTCLRKNEKDWGNKINNFGKSRSQITHLNLSDQGLSGSLDLSDFTNLRYVYTFNQTGTDRLEIINKNEQVNVALSNWMDINPFFVEEYQNSNQTCQQKWEEQGFAYEEVKEWFNAWEGVFPYDGLNLYAWLKNEKKIDAQWVRNNVDPNNESETSKLFEKWLEEYHEWVWLRDNGTCPYCQRFNTSLEWCRDCNAKRFQ